MGDYIITHSKVRFTPLEPNTKDIKIEDISHALSLMTRANGHFPEFYSVAQHSIHCAMEAIACECTDRIVLACLLHDASEVYISDITRPVKRNLSKYIEIEKKLQDTIYDKYLDGGITEEEERTVKRIDDALLYYEFEHYMEVQMFKEKPIIKSNPVFETEPFKNVELRYRQIFKMLVGNDNEVVNHAEYTTVGVDGCKGKWLAVEINPKGFTIQKYNTISELCNTYEYSDAILIDMPIGLPENKEEEKHRPDSALRRILKGKASSVFSVPCRQAVYGSNKDDIREKNIATLDKSLSAQSIAIIPKIREVDEFLEQNPKWKNCLQESHPEVAFCILNDNKPIMEKKIDTTGMEKRMQVIEKYYSYVYEVKEQFLSMGYGMGCLNDLLDALCLAVVGQLGLRSGLKSIPENPKEDARGILMQVVVPDMV